MDGPFSTILPTYWNEHSEHLDSFLLYNVRHSVLDEKKSYILPNYNNISNHDIHNRFKKILENVQYYIPEFNVINNYYESIIGDRVIMPNIKNTDERLSQIISTSKNYFLIFQGKIDYSLNVADDILNRLLKRYL